MRVQEFIILEGGLQQSLSDPIWERELFIN